MSKGRKKINAVGLFAMTIVLQACMLEDEAGIPGDLFSDRINYQQRHPVFVSEKPETLTFPISAYHTKINRDMANAALQFANDAHRDGAPVYIMFPRGPMQRKGQYVAMQLRHLMIKAGIQPNRVLILPTQGNSNEPGNTLKLARMSMKPSVHDCATYGQWRDVYGEVHPGHSKFGCASQSNFAAMIANPTDLLQPQPEVSDSSGRSNTVIGTYQQTKVGAPGDDGFTKSN